MLHEMEMDACRVVEQASRPPCWFNWEKQITPMERLVRFRFELGASGARGPIPSLPRPDVRRAEKMHRSHESVLISNFFLGNGSGNASIGRRRLFGVERPRLFLEDLFFDQFFSHT